MNLASILVDNVIQLSQSRRDVDSWRELCEQALHLLAERERELKASRAACQHLRDQLRARREEQVAA